MLEIIKVRCPEKQIKIKCPYEMKPSRIVIHNTANDASARNEISYMHRNSETTSFHFAVDDKEIVQGIELNRNAWHASDGRTGKGNRQGIAIEICYSKSGGERFEKAQENAAWLTAKLLKDYNFGIDKVTKHSDYCRKYCPHRTLNDFGWEYFLNLVRKYLLESTELPKEDNPVLLWQKAASKDGFEFPKWGIDGKWGNECKSVAKSAVCKKRTSYKFENLTKIVQKTVGVTVDGKFGSDTKRAVILYQKDNELVGDGCVGLKTWSKILGVK